MDDGEIEFSDQDVFAECNDLSVAGSMDTFLDELFKNTHACTHTHTCNPPGPDNTHTHTCIHTHTQLFAPSEEGKATDEAQTLSDPSIPSSKKRPSGNREAVRKYREKKKAHTAYLEEQLMQLRRMNQQLVRRLQGQAALEAEIVRLRSLLSEFRGRIDGELGAQKLPLPVQKESVLQPLPGGYYLNSFHVPCDADMPCFHSLKGNESSPSTPQDHPSLAVGSGVSCEIVGENFQGKGRRPGSRKQKEWKIGTKDGTSDV